MLLTREGDGHTAYSSGNRCIVKAVDAYLVDGTVPRDGTTCPDE
ncbi:MAG: alpha/beta hydrolase [Aeromicrobium erythreum]